MYVKNIDKLFWTILTGIQTSTTYFSIYLFDLFIGRTRPEALDLYIFGRVALGRFLCVTLGLFAVFGAFFLSTFEAVFGAFFLSTLEAVFGAFFLSTLEAVFGAFFLSILEAVFGAFFLGFFADFGAFFLSTFEAVVGALFLDFVTVFGTFFLSFSMTLVPFS